MNRETEIKDSIKKKFGTLSRFLKLSGFNYHKIHYAIKNQNFEWLRKVINETDNEVIYGYDLTDEMRSKIRIEILKRYKSISEFCRENDYYDYWIWRVINGPSKVITPKIKNLIQTLNINL